MPLSEQEQRLLEEMERSLYQNDADFIATVGGRRGRPNYSIVVLGVLLGLAGIAVLVTGVVVRQPLVGLLGFAVMFAGVLLAITPSRKSGAASAPRAGGPGAATTGAPRKRGFMENLNERWDKREEDRDR